MARLLDACAQAGHATCLLPAGGRPASPSGIVLDIAGDYRPALDGEVWRLRAGGRGLLDRFALSGVWHRAPWHTSVTLTQSRGGLAEEIVGIARIGTIGGYFALREKAAATAAILLRRALSHPGEADRSLEPDEAGRTPSDGPLALIGGWLRAQAARWNSRLFDEWWTVGICQHSIETVLRQGRLGPITWLRPRPGNAYWADPFAWPGTDRILCEEFAVAGGPGTIAVLQPRPDGTWGREHLLLGDHLHRSYPFTFCEDGEVYLLPECLGEGVILHRLNAAGDVTKFATVVDSALADATLFRHEDRYWVAGTDPAVGPHDNLCLFHADHLAGPWWPHRGNPVKIDIRSSRPAGTPFVADGVLFRPAQDCAAAYGAAVVVNRVIALTPDSFLERPALRLAPDPDGPLPDGLHTLSAAGRITLVDGKRMVPAPVRALRRVAARLGLSSRRANGRGGR